MAAVGGSWGERMVEAALAEERARAAREPARGVRTRLLSGW